MLDNERWYIKQRKGNPEELAQKLGVSVQLARLLITKSLNDEKRARDFLYSSPEKFYPSALMKDMDVALDILQEAAESDVPALVIGDYDVDGVAGVYILCDVLSRRFSNVMHYIPHRVADGYGINERIVKYAHDAGVRLIITCDNGISATESVAQARSLGMRVIITDHHVAPEGNIPDADAVIDPKRNDCEYPFKDLCGAAVAYKLAIAFAEKVGVQISEEDYENLLSLATIATICDIVDLIDENRAIVTYGLRMLNSGVKNVGLRELINVCGLSAKELNTYNIGHILGPCLNATGRLDSAELSYQLLAETDRTKARHLAELTLGLNRKRQEFTAEATELACITIDRNDYAKDSVIVLHQPGMHESVAGIVAGKIKDRYARPAIVLADTPQGILKGSGRSVEGYNLLEAVARASDLLIKHGGHAMAIGLSVEKESLSAFRDSLLKICDLPAEELYPKELIDLCLAPDEINLKLIRDISLLEPFGRGNPRPQFAARGFTIDYAAIVGVRRNVVRIKFSTSAQLFDGVYFGDPKVFLRVIGMSADDLSALAGGWVPKPLVDVIFYPEINEYNGSKRMQLVVRSIRPAQMTI